MKRRQLAGQLPFPDTLPERVAYVRVLIERAGVQNVSDQAIEAVLERFPEPAEAWEAIKSIVAGVAYVSRP